MKKLIAAVLGLIVSVVLIGAVQELIWKEYQPPQIVGSEMRQKGITHVDRTKLSREWFAYYTDELTGMSVPYDFRIKKARIDNVEALDDAYVQIDATIWPASSNQEIINNLGLISMGKRHEYQCQMVLKWTEDGRKWTIDEKLSPVQYQLQTPEMQEEIHRPQTEHYAMQTDEKMTYFIENNVLYVTYDGGENFQEVEDGYEKVCKEVNGSYQELLPYNSYVITPEFTAFVSYSDEKTSLLYSQDAGKTWQESEIYDGGFKANTFVAKTEHRCYVTFAVDRSLGSDYYTTFQSEDLQTWNKVSLSETFWSNLTCSFWSNDETGYYSNGADAFYMTTDGGAGFQEVKYPVVQEIADELGFYPYDTMEKMYCEDGKTYMVVGQGDDGDYVRDGKMMKALYESQDGVNFTFVKEIADSPVLAG